MKPKKSRSVNAVPRVVPEEERQALYERLALQARKAVEFGCVRHGIALIVIPWSLVHARAYAPSLRSPLIEVVPS